MLNYLTQVWGKSLSLNNAEPIVINGLEAATASANVRLASGPGQVRLVAIRFGAEQVARFMILIPSGLSASAQQGLQRMTYSFRALSATDAAKLKPLRIRAVTVQPGDTVQTLAARMPYPDFRVERFRAINGLEPRETLTTGTRVKLISE